MNRTLALVLSVLLALVGTSCGSDDDKPSVDELNDSDRVEVAGISFAKPEGWIAIEPGDLADASDDEAMDDVLEALDVDAETFSNMVGQTDVFLVDEAGATGGYADNINVIDQGGAVPDEAAVKAQYESVQAENVSVRSEDSALGEVLIGSYDLDVGRLVVSGRSVLVDQDGLVVVTVSAQTPAAADELVEGIIDTLDEG